jgi:hypothetical protein
MLVPAAKRLLRGADSLQEDEIVYDAHAPFYRPKAPEAGVRLDLPGRTGSIG